MEYASEVSEVADRKFKKLVRKNRGQLEIIHKKIQQILQNPHHFKPLRGDMHGARRVHIDSSFVLLYEIDDKRKVVRILDYDHHDVVWCVYG